MRLSIWLALIGAASMVGAFLIQWLVVVIIGPGRETDALIASAAVPQLILAVVSGSLIHVLVPLLAGEDVETARKEGWTLLLGVTALFGVFAMILGITSGWWVPAIFPGFEASGVQLLLDLSRIQFLGMIFTAAAAVLAAYCYSRNRFVLAESTQLGATILAAASIYWILPIVGIRGAAWVTVARSAAVTLFLLPFLGRFALAERAGDLLRKAWERIRPLLVGSLYYKTDPLIDRMLASMAPAGALSLYYLGSQMSTSGAQVLNISVAAPLIPKLAAYAKSGEWDLFRAAYRKRLAVLLGLTVAPYLVLIFAGRSLLELVIGYGGVTSENVAFLWQVMVALGGVLIAGSLGYVTSGAFYARGDTRTPTRIGIVSYTIYVPLKILVFVRFGLIGVAISTSIYFIVNVVVQFYLAERKGF
jgi:putative peptidoglycan lipid II flippase